MSVIVFFPLNLRNGVTLPKIYTNNYELYMTHDTVR